MGDIGGDGTSGMYSMLLSCKKVIGFVLEVKEECKQFTAIVPFA